MHDNFINNLPTNVPFFFIKIHTNLWYIAKKSFTEPGETLQFVRNLSRLAQTVLRNNVMWFRGLGQCIGIHWYN